MSEQITDSDSYEVVNLLDNAIQNGDFTGLEQYHVIRRNGQLTCFDTGKIINAMTQAFLAVEGDTATTSNRIQNAVSELAKQIIKGISRRLRDYREEHAHKRAEKPEQTIINVIDDAGRHCPLNEDRLRIRVSEACINLFDVTPNRIIEESLKNLFDGISKRDVNHVFRSITLRCPQFCQISAHFCKCYGYGTLLSQLF